MRGGGCALPFLGSLRRGDSSRRFGVSFKGKSTSTTAYSEMEQGLCSSLLCSLDLDEVASPAPCPSQPALGSVVERLVVATAPLNDKFVRRGLPPPKFSNMGDVLILLIVRRASLKALCR